MNPLVSVVIPVYNSALFLKECIDSVINQTYQNIEIIIVDDGSTDESCDIIEKYYKDNVKLIRQKNSGASSARNNALNYINGKYVQFLDSDDYLDNKKIEIQIQNLKQANGVLAFGDTKFLINETSAIINNENIFESEYAPLDLIKKLYGYNDNGSMITVSSWLTNVEIIKNAGRWNETLTQDDDGEYFNRVILNSNKIIFCKDSIDYYRKYKTHNSISNRKDLKALESRFNSINLKLEVLKNYLDSNTLNIIFSRHYFEVAYEAFPYYSKLYKMANLLSSGFDYKNRFIFGRPAFQKLTKYIDWRIIKLIQIIYRLLNTKILSN